MATNKSTNNIANNEYDSEDYIFAGLVEACKEMNLARRGKLEGVEASEYIKKLIEEDSSL